MLLPKLGGLWLFPPWDFPHQSESHPMDHDSISSGHTKIQVLTPKLGYFLPYILLSRLGPTFRLFSNKLTIFMEVLCAHTRPAYQRLSIRMDREVDISII